jgi:hypothetical protein
MVRYDRLFVGGDWVLPTTADVYESSWHRPGSESVVARGLSTRDITEHLAELYGVGEQPRSRRSLRWWSTRSRPEVRPSGGSPAVYAQFIAQAGSEPLARRA